jgi:hypothetical protein
MPGGLTLVDYAQFQAFKALNVETARLRLNIRGLRERLIARCDAKFPHSTLMLNGYELSNITVDVVRRQV